MWSMLEIAGKPAAVFDLPAPARPRFALLFLHDLSGETLTQSPVFTRLLETQQLTCLCPHGGQSWWADRICAAFDPQLPAMKHLMQNVVPLFHERWGLAPPRVGLFGIGMGCQGALRLAFQQPRTFPVVAGISAALDYYELYDRGSPLDGMYDSKEQCRQDTALLHLHPARFPPHIFFGIDPDDRLWYRGNDRLHEKMKALGVPHQIDFMTRAGGHSWAYYQHMAERVVQFLVNGLVEESRRLL